MGASFFVFCLWSRLSKSKERRLAPLLIPVCVSACSSSPRGAVYGQAAAAPAFFAPRPNIFVLVVCIYHEEYTSVASARNVKRSSPCFDGKTNAPKIFGRRRDRSIGVWIKWTDGWIYLYKIDHPHPPLNQPTPPPPPRPVDSRRLAASKFAPLPWRLGRRSVVDACK